MHPSPEITLDMTAEDLLKTLSNDNDTFEVDDIAAVDPLADTSPLVTKAAGADELADGEVTLEFDSLEIELSAEDMNAMLDVNLTAKKE
jgi:hypothetical protein